MGGEGSGRVQEKITAVELMMTEDDFRAVVVNESVKNYLNHVQFLQDVIAGNITDVRLNPKGDKIELPVTADVRVKACKVWKEMTLDKVVSDKKMLAMPENQLSLLEDFSGAVKKVESEILKASEVVAEKEGKLVRMNEK